MTASWNVADTVLDGLAQIRDWQEDFYRDLHQHPELSHQEAETAGKVVGGIDPATYQKPRPSRRPR